MAICGPKLSLCGLILSVWGIIQLGLMGLFYYLRSVAFIEDLPEIEEPESAHDLPEFYKHIEDAYDQAAMNCWIATGMYVVVLLISAQQFWANNHASKVKK